MSQKINVDIVSDIACPWCFVGKKHFEKALEMLPEYEITVHWKPFQLDPTIPTEGLDYKDYIEGKFGSISRFDGMFEHLKNVGKKAGIEFNTMNRIPNTLRFHNLLHVASEEGFANELKEALFEAYFEKSMNLTDDGTIVALMSKFGWDEPKTLEVMHSLEISKMVKQEIHNAQKLGISGVPYFIINNKYGISGAQPTEVFVNSIRGIGAEMSKMEAASCSMDDPNC